MRTCVFSHWLPNSGPFPTHNSDKVSRRLAWPGLGWKELLMAATEGEFCSHLARVTIYAAQLPSTAQKEVKQGSMRRKRTVTSTRESMKDCLWVGRELEKQKKKGIAGEYKTRKDRQRSESQFVCSLVGWHWLRPAFLPWPHCQSSQTGVCTHVGIYTQVHTDTHILGLSRARVRLSPNYSNYLSSKHSLPWLPPGIHTGCMCRTEN